MCTRVDTNLLFLCGALFYILLLLSSNVEGRRQKHSNLSAEDPEAQVAVRAVFINCAPENLENSDGEIGKKVFEREELYRHGQLQDCRKKIAFTIKLPSHPGKHGGEEYIPVEHVFDGSSKQRVRILDPYVLRLQRDAPVQAYNLHLIDTIKGVLTKKSVKPKKEKYKDQKKKRRQRDAENDPESDYEEHKFQLVDDFRKENVTSNNNRTDFNISYDDVPNIPNSESIGPCMLPTAANNGLPSQLHKEKISSPEIIRVRRDICSNNFLSWRRRKRNAHNVIIEDNIDEDKMPIWMAKDQADQQTFRRDTYDLEKSTTILDDVSVTINGDDVGEIKDNLYSNHKREYEFFSNDDSSIQKDKDAVSPEFHQGKEKSKRGGKQKKSDEIHFTDDEKEFTLYSIRDPQFWHTVNVQLFEKATDDDGKTIWNDITRGATASVGPSTPTWQGPELIVKYRSLEWLGRDEFTVPKKPHCLLIPVNTNSFTEKGDSEDFKHDMQYIIVPEEDILGAESLLRRRNISDDLDFDPIGDPLSEEPVTDEKPIRRVIVRVSKALMGSNKQDMDVVMKDSKPYLTLPHQQTHRAQIDLEANADDNQLVRVGEYGRLTTVVSDSTRPARTVLTIQASNTGLAAARFKAVVKDLDPELMELLNESGKGVASVASSPVLLPPRHTRKIKIELPVEIPGRKAHCSVALLNHKDEAVAIRDVLIKKDDRCFCVWHCECVCLSDDPKLECRWMPETRLVAAGLTKEDRPRHARQCDANKGASCDVIKDKEEKEEESEDDGLVSAAFLVTGVLTGLLILGFTKAMVGLFHREIALWGLDKVVMLPRPIPKYQEVWLQNREVVYDDEGWPVNPDDPSHRVAFMPLMSMIYLNTTLFATLPFILMKDGLFCICNTNKKGSASSSKKKSSMSRASSAEDVSKKSKKSKSKNKSTVQANVQGAVRRRRGRYLDEPWMSPDAEDLFSEVFKSDDGSEPHDDDYEEDDLLQPLIKSFSATKDFQEVTSSTDDNLEQDDTEYVLTQMQKSRESLSKLHGKHNTSPKLNAKQEKNLRSKR